MSGVLQISVDIQSLINDDICVGDRALYSLSDLQDALLNQFKNSAGKFHQVELEMRESVRESTKHSPLIKR